MWLFKITPSDQAIEMGAQENVQMVNADDVDSFFKHRGEWRWDTVERLMQQGLIVRVEIDYKPGVLGS